MQNGCIQKQLRARTGGNQGKAEHSKLLLSYFNGQNLPIGK